MWYDNIKLCEKCGEYTTGRLCRSCAEQEAIDSGVADYTEPAPTCVECGSEAVEFVGYEDGGGDYGDSFSRVYTCVNCGATFAL